MRRWSVGVEQRAASLSRGWPRANTDKSFYCTHTSTPLSPLHCSSPLYYSLPLLHFLAHHPAVHFSCHFSVVVAFRCVFNADLHLWLPAFRAPGKVANAVSGGILSVFQKVELLVWMGGDAALWAACTDGTWLSERSHFCLWLHVHHSSGKTRRSSVRCVISERLFMRMSVSKLKADGCDITASIACVRPVRGIGE